MAKLDKHKDKLDEEFKDPTEVEQEDDSKAIEEPAAPTAQGRFRRLLQSRKFRIAAPIVVLVLVAVGFFVAPVKYAVLNLFSNGKAQFVVVDDATLAPVSGATVKVGGVSGKTDKNGKLTLKGLDFGSQIYTLTKDSYTTKKADFTVKTGDNLVGPVKAHSDGFPVEVHAVNKLSGAKMTDFAVSIDGTNISAQSTKAGVATLKVPSKRLGKQTLAITAKGFNKTTVETTLSSSKAAPLNVSLVVAGKHYFLSNRDGVISVYSANLDGSDQALVIKGSSSDDSSTMLSTSPDGKYGVMVSKRDQTRDSSGKVAPALFAIDYSSKTIKRIDEGAPNFYISGWVDDTRVLYTVGYSDPTRSDNEKIKTADASNGKLSTIAAYPGYPQVMLFRDAPTYVYVQLTDPSKPEYGVYAYNIATKAKQQIEAQSVSYFTENKPGYVIYQADNNWRELNLKTNKTQSVSPAVPDAYPVYVLSPNSQKVAWIESRDGKAAIIVGNSDGSNGKQITKTINAGVVVRWLSDDYLITTATGSDGATADYAVSVSTGLATKISGVYAVQYR
jgi:Tol biopolymer transport system component